MKAMNIYIHMYWHARQSICYLGVVAFHTLKARLLVLAS